MTPLKTFDLKACVLIIGSIQVTGFGEDDACTLEAAEDLVTPTVSADGQVVVSRNNNDMVTATISVMETSLACRQLGELARNQRAQPSILPLPFLLRDPNNGDRITDRFAVFAGLPMPSKSKGASVREFTIILPNGKAPQNLTLAGSVVQ